MIVVIGASGRLGAALLRILVLQHGMENVQAPVREVYQSWGQPTSGPEIHAYLKPWLDDELIVFVVSGVLNPRDPAESHDRVNVLLPVQIISATDGCNARVVTFGTIMERLIDTPNLYIASKAKLGRHVEKQIDAGRHLAHIRIHTLYGGAPSPFMFSGLMIDAIRTGRPFNMTLGKQLREYHHIDDDACAIAEIARAGHTGLIELNHGMAVSLAELAQHVFDGCDASGLLHIGALPEPPEENYQTRFIRPAIMNAIPFRDTLPAVTDYVRRCVKNDK